MLRGGAVVAALCGCSPSSDLPALPPQDGTTPTGPCNTVFFAPPIEAGFHVDECSYIEFPTNPPSSGHHYAVWADFKAYAKPVAPGYWVHSIEHGGVALLYGCDPMADTTCSEMVAEISRYVNARPADELCEPPLNSRLLVLPDPALGAAFAAVAWGHYLRAECFDAELVTLLIDHYYGKNYEDTCAPGFDPSDEPSSCGMP